MKKRNRKSFGRTIKEQWDHEINVRKSYNGESSPYWEWVAANMEKTDDGFLKEVPQANPDTLGDYDNYDNERSYYTNILDEGYALLTARERQVFNLLKIGMTEEEIAERLKTIRINVHMRRKNIQKKFLEVSNINA